MTAAQRRDVIELFVPGKLTNPLNGALSRAHWTIKSDWAYGWKLATWNAIHDQADLSLVGDPAVPKRVTFTAQVGRLWDDDNLPAGLKPCRDALMGRALPGNLVRYRVIHSDAPDSGHQFEYAQVVNRKERGVRITITPVAP